MNISRKYKKMEFRGQTMVEFAIVMPVLMMILVGIFEVGRMIYVYAAVTNASREAVRYGSAIGRDSAYTGSPQRYKNCQGIRDMAKRSAYFIPLTITISYDHGPNCNAISGEDASVTVTSGDRVKVRVQATYKPLIKLIPIGTHNIDSWSARTILGIFDLGS
jgi:Flp pilus assembly protein TadG